MSITDDQATWFEQTFEQLVANVELAIDASGLDFTADPATEAWQNSRPRHYLAEHGGYIRLRSADINETRVRPGHAAHFDSVDFYLDDRLLDVSLDSREVQDYVATTPGRHVVNLRRTGASASSPPIFSAPVDLAAGRDYSLLVIGRPGALAILPVDDTVSTSPPAGQALIHYVNANRVEPNWNIGPLDVYLDGVLRVAALAVGQSSPYVPIAPGQHLVEFFKTGDVPGGGHREAHKTFVVAAGEAILLGTGRHDDDDGDLTDTEQRAFVGQAPARIPGVLLASVPFSALPYLAADAHLTGPVVVPAGAQTFAATVRNSGARNAGLNGLLPTVRTPLASAFELAARSPAISGLSAGLRSADVQYLGITSNYPSTPNLATASLYFGFSTYAPWSTPNEVQFLVYIDSNRDGTDDYALASTNWGTATGGAATDVPISSLYPVRAGGALGAGVPYSYWGAFPSPVAGGGVNITPFNTAVGYQQVGLSDLGMPLDPARPNGPKGPPPAKFCYHVETRARDRAFFGEVVDRVPDAAAPAIAACNNRAGVLLYDVQNYAIAPINTANLVFGQGSAARPVFVDIDGGQISGGVNSAVLAARGAELLVLHHQNAPYPQAEVVGVSR